MSTAVEESTSKPYVVPPMSVQQEDAIIHTRITNDEKALRRVTKKFHNYTSVAYDPVIPPSPAVTVSVDDARDAFLVELASFHLSLKKSFMVCEAEARQVEEYQREREHIAEEHGHLRDQIEELKLKLEQAQLQRKRKMEYDMIAEKVNALPSRDELEQSIRSLENDMTAIRTEHENQSRIIFAQKGALERIVSDLSELRVMGKQDVADLSRGVTPTIEIHTVESVDVDMDAGTREESGELKEDKDETGAHDRDSEEEDIPLAKTVNLNPSARAFLPPTSRTSTPQLQSSTAGTPATTPVPLMGTSREEPEEGEEEDIEMGELAEEPKVKPKKMREEELEEGEASDLSSELSDPPDD